MKPKDLILNYLHSVPEGPNKDFYLRTENREFSPQVNLIKIAVILRNFLKGNNKYYVRKKGQRGLYIDYLEHDIKLLRDGEEWVSNVLKDAGKKYGWKLYFYSDYCPYKGISEQGLFFVFEQDRGINDIQRDVR